MIEYIRALTFLPATVIAFGAAIGACSFGNAPEEPIAPVPTSASSGQGGSGGASSTGGSGGMTPTCEMDETVCGDDCVNTKTDAAHCGGCDMACKDDEGCTEGLCCPEGQSNCGDACIDTKTDAAHCGACDIACSGNDSCVDGKCEFVCPAGQVDCGGNCIDPMTDTMFCGAETDCMGSNDGEVCGVDSPVGDMCAAGVCIGKRILINNGDFGTGKFPPWQVKNSGLGEDKVIVFAVNKSDQAFAGGQGGPSQHVLYQDFTVPTNVSQATLTFLLDLGQPLAPISNPNNPYTPNQSNGQITTGWDGLRVDIVDAQDDLFLGIPQLEIIAPTAPTQIGVQADPVKLLDFLQKNEGKNLRLRYGVVATDFPFQVTIDDVKFEVTGH